MKNIKNEIVPMVEENEGNINKTWDLYSKLLKDRIVMLNNEVNNVTSSLICAELLYLNSQDNKSPIEFYINSPGGSVSAGLGIYDTMKFIHCEVSTVCTGMAASMAAVLLACGTEGKRYALPHSRVMIHQPLGGVSGQASDIEIEANLIKKYKEELTSLIAQHSHQDYEKVLKDCDRNYWMTAQEAKEYGIVDSIMSRKKD